MLSEKKHRLAGLMIGLVILMATPAFARSITWNDLVKDAGVAFWIFAIIGVILVLLQLIPAIIAFFSFVATMTDPSQRRRLQKQ